MALPANLLKTDSNLSPGTADNDEKPEPLGSAKRNGNEYIFTFLLRGQNRTTKFFLNMFSL